MSEPQELIIGSDDRGRLIFRSVQSEGGADREMIVTLETGQLKATVRIQDLRTGAPDWGEFDGLVALFEFLTENWQGWEGARGWASEDHDLDISVTSDSLGHITLAVRMSHYLDEWKADGRVHLDAGQLSEVEQEVRSFLRNR